jgi:hypothetical protein
MSFLRMVTAQCDVDDCLTIADGSGWTVNEAWAIAREQGWHRNGARTICPVCWDEGRR